MNTEVKKGQALVSRIRERMAADGEAVSSLAESLDISQSYLSQLLRGDKAIASANDDFIRGVAAYLHLPPVVCFVLAGKLGREDFFVNDDDERRRFERAMGAVADSAFALEIGVDRRILQEADRRLQHLIVMLYQGLSATGEVFPARDAWSWLTQRGQ